MVSLFKPIKRVSAVVENTISVPTSRLRLPTNLSFQATRAGMILIGERLETHYKQKQTVKPLWQLQEMQQA
jgi:hypothetical protein